MMPTVVVAVVVVVVVVAAVVLLLVRRREPNTVDSFQRQIDALSPEARRPVVDQVNQAADDDTAHDTAHGGHDDVVADDGDAAGEPGEREGGSDGT